MKNFIFYARTNPRFNNSLISEIKSIAEITNIKSLKEKRLNLIQFEAPLNKIWKVLLYSRLAEDIKIEIKDKLKIKTEKDLKISIAKIKDDFSKFLPMNQSNKFIPPKIKVYSYRSELFHEKMIENIIKTSLNKMAFNISSESNRNVEKLRASDFHLDIKEELITKLEKRKNLIEIPRIDVILQENHMRILLNLTNNPLYKHEYKEKQNWGSLRETYAAALFYETELIEKMNKETKLLIWDPFCGAGTLLIEAFSIIFQRHARKIKTIAEEGFTHLPFHKKDDFNKFLKEELKLSSSYVINIESEFDCRFIGSDINNKSLTALSENSKTGKLNLYTVQSNNEILNKTEDYSKIINPIIYHEKINNVFDCFMGDFEAIWKNVLFCEINKNKKFNIFTHLPYGESSHMDDKVKIKKLYQRFGKFLRKYSEFVDDVFIIINKRDEKDLLNFKILSELKWNIMIEFENNGITVELLKLVRE